MDRKIAGMFFRWKSNGTESGKMPEPVAIERVKRSVRECIRKTERERERERERKRKRKSYWHLARLGREAVVYS